MIFDLDALYKTPLDNMRLYKKQYRSMITDDMEFTSAVCNFVIGALTPNATCAVHGMYFSFFCYLQQAAAFLHSLSLV